MVTSPPETSMGYAWRVLLVVSLAGFFGSLSSSILNVAVPVVVRHFHASSVAATWIVLTPQLANVGFLLFFGRLADMLGRRRLLLAGVGTFTLASCALGLAPGAWWLVGLELVQAVATAAIYANGAPLIVDAFPPARVGQGLGMYFASFSVASMLGPSVGGFIADTFGWRWIFWLNVPGTAACAVVGWLVLRKPTSAGRTGGIDLAGNLLIFVGVMALLVSFTQVQGSGWSSPVVVGGLITCLVIGAVFVMVELRVADPLLDLTLFRDRSLSLALLTAFLTAMAQWGVVLLMALFFQAAYGNSAVLAGLKVTPISVATAALAASAGLLARRAGPRALVAVAVGILTAGVLLIALALTSGYVLVLVGLILAGVGNGIFQPANTNAIIMGIPPDRISTINASRMMLQQIGFFTSTAVALTIVTARLSAAVRADFFAGNVSKLSPGGVADLLGGYRLAFALIAGVGFLAILAAVASWRYARPQQVAAG